LVRIGGTAGWLAAGLLVSHVLAADSSPVAAYGGAVAMLCSSLVAFGAPPTLPRGSGRDWRSLLGIDALQILRQRDQRVFFITTALISVPLVAFYMHAPAQLKDLGDPHPTATMAIGQMVEVLGLLAISRLMEKYRMKVLLGWALVWFVVRYLLFMVAGLTGERAWMLPGVALQGVCFTLYFITAQVFLDRRVDAGLRGQAQGLLSLASGGIGSLAGTLFTGWLHRVTVADGAGGWPVFWGVLAAMLAGCAAYFLSGYRGRGAS
jgi:MFS family permease